jgi:cytoskeletal protein CcmA (bactofilin family)
MARSTETWSPWAKGASLLVISARKPGRRQGDCRPHDHQWHVNGPVECPDELLELQPKARIEGDVRYGTIGDAPRAAIDGEVRTIKPSEKPRLKLAANNRL